MYSRWWFRDNPNTTKLKSIGNSNNVKSDYLDYISWEYHNS